MTLKQPPQHQELIKWFIKYRLRNGLEGCYSISTSEKDDLWNRIPKICEDKGLNFLEFDSKTHRILIQASQLVFYQFLFDSVSSEPSLNEDAGETEDEDEDEGSADDYAVKIYVTHNPDPMVFYVDEDQPDPKDEGDEGEMGNFIFHTLHVCDEGDWLHFTDEDGETAFFRGSDMALVEIPLRVLQSETLLNDS